jgi:hypothetical protein
MTPCVNGYCVDGFNTYMCVCDDGYTGRNCDEEVIVRSLPMITESPRPTTGRAGQPINLTCTVTGSPTPAITWFRDRDVIPNAIFQFLYIPAAKPEDRGSYYCRAENSEGVAQSDQALVTLEGIQQFGVKLTFPARRKREDTADPTSMLANALVGQMIPGSDVTIYSVSVTGTGSLLVTVAAAGDIPQGGVGGALANQITETAEAAGIQVVVEVTRYDGCPMELGQSYIPYWPNFRIQWPELEIGQMATESCACGALNSSSYLATRICGGNYSNGAMWEAQDVSQCSFSNSTLELCQASELPVVEQAVAVAEAVSDPNQIDSETFSVAVDLFDSLLNDALDNPEIVTDVLDGIDSILDVSGDVVKQSQSGNTLLSALEDFAGDIDITPGQRSQTLSEDNFALHAENVDTNDFEGITFSTNSRNSFRSGTVGSSSGSSVPLDAVASIVLPQSVLGRVNSTGSQRISFSLFDDDALFQPLSTPEVFRGLNVGSVIVSATIYDATATGLSDPVTARFQKSTPNSPSTCVFWDPLLGGGYGGFSTTGCTTADGPNEVTCSCNHLTSFTILSNTTEPVTQQPPSVEVDDDDDDDADHSAVVYLLLSICLVILLLTIALHLGLRVLRATQESRILVNFCGALFGLYFVTMLAYGEDMPEGACRLWAFLMDYFFIVALIWTFAEALLVFLRQKMPSFDDRFLTRNLSWIFLPIAWGVPIVPALISIAGLDYYGEYRLCQLYNWPFYAFLVAPLVIIYALNWFLFMGTLVIITRKGLVAKSKDAQHSVFYHVFAAMILSLIYGIGWAFGFIASSNVSRDAYLTTQYLFSFLIFAHTILQFVFYLPSREELGRLWSIVTRRSKGYDIEEPAHGQRSNDYVAVAADKNVEAIGLEESVLYSGSEKQPLQEPTKDGSPPKGAANRLADDPAAVTSYTNKTAVEGGDDPISSL